MMNPDEPDVHDDDTLPTINTKMGDQKEQNYNLELQDIIDRLSPMTRKIVNDTLNFSSSITIYRIVSTVETSIVGIENTANGLKYTMSKFLEFNTIKSIDEGTHKISQSSKTQFTNITTISYYL